MKIVVIGGTGLIGSKVVQKLAEQGHEAVAAAPNTGVNTITGEGLSEALRNADVVVDLANSPSFEEKAAMEFFQTAGKNLTVAEVRAGVKHHVALSVVGTERLQASGYFRAKLAQERAIMSSPIPYTLIHATQFFEFIRTIADFSMQGSAVHVPITQFQPIAAEDVASAVARAALSEPLNGTLEIAGPEKRPMEEMIRQVLSFDKDQRKVIGDPEALYYGAAVDERSLVPDAGANLGPTRLDWWLENVPAPPRKT